jgi:hypothetical protein
MYYDIAAAVLVALGLGLIFFLDNLISKDVSNEYLQYIRKNNTICGLVAIALGYYVYTLGEHDLSDVSDASEGGFFARMSRPKKNLSSDMSGYKSSKSFKSPSSTDDVLNL